MKDRFEDYRGLAAEVYDAVWSEEVDDLPFFTWILGPPTGRLLELGCGTGRILLPLLKDGWRGDGIDASETMLALCREKLENEGLSARLHRQKIEELSLTDRYHRIIIPGFTFQHLLTTEGSLAALRRIRAHLTYRGRLIISLFLPWESVRAGDERTWKLRSTAPLAEGRTVLCHESMTVDPVHQELTVWNRYETVDPDGKPLEQTLVRNRIRWFGLEEFKLLLTAAGFDRIEVYGDFSPDPPTASSTYLTFEARPGSRKPSPKTR